MRYASATDVVPSNCPVRPEINLSLTAEDYSGTISPPILNQYKQYDYLIVKNLSIYDRHNSDGCSLSQYNHFRLILTRGQNQDNLFDYTYLYDGNITDFVLITLDETGPSPSDNKYYNSITNNTFAEVYNARLINTSDEYIVLAEFYNQSENITYVEDVMVHIFADDGKKLSSIGVISSLDYSLLYQNEQTKILSQYSLDISRSSFTVAILAIACALIGAIVSIIIQNQNLKLSIVNDSEKLGKTNWYIGYNRIYFYLLTAIVEVLLMFILHYEKYYYIALIVLVAIILIRETFEICKLENNSITAPETFQKSSMVVSKVYKKKEKSSKKGK